MPQQQPAAYKFKIFDKGTYEITSERPIKSKTGFVPLNLIFQWYFLNSWFKCRSWFKKIYLKQKSEFDVKLTWLEMKR